MQVELVKIGNSRGIRLPKKIIDQCHIESTMNLVVTGNRIILEPNHLPPRTAWKKSAKQMHDCGDDALLIADVFDDEVT